VVDDFAVDVQDEPGERLIGVGAFRLPTWGGEAVFAE